MAELKQLDTQVDEEQSRHTDLHTQYDKHVARYHELVRERERLSSRFHALVDEAQRSNSEAKLREANALVPQINSLVDRINVEAQKANQLDTAHEDLKARARDIGERRDRLIAELRERVNFLESQKSTAKERVVQHQNHETKVDVGRGFDRRTGQFTTDVRIYDRDPSVDTHRHLGISEQTGDAIFDEERPDKKK